MPAVRFIVRPYLEPRTGSHRDRFTLEGPVKVSTPVREPLRAAAKALNAHGYDWRSVILLETPTGHPLISGPLWEHLGWRLSEQDRKGLVWLQAREEAPG